MQPEEAYGHPVRHQLARVLSSQAFARNERLGRFLTFLVERRLEGRASELKESVIGVEVFNRKPDYDPKLDSIVRTEAIRLRARLSKYYAEEGSRDPVIIELPKGGYTPVFRDAESPPVQRETRSRVRWLALGLAVGMLAVAAAGVLRHAHKDANLAIAVLPLANLNSDPDSDYFADGLTDELIRNLSVIEGLAVRSRTSSFAFKGKPRDLREAGKQLAVDYILEGSVLRAGQQLRVNAQLIRVRDDFPVWSGKLDRELTDVFAIQDEVSRGIVNQLRLNLGRGRRRYETSTEAYDLYLRARSNLLLGPRLRQSMEQFEQAITGDHSFAPAHAGLAVALVLRSVSFPLDHPPDELAKMRAAAKKAIQLDPLLPEAHHALAMIHARDGKWEESEESFRRAIELDRNRSNIRADFAVWLLLVFGRVDEALQQLNIAVKADPLSPEVHGYLALALTLKGRHAEALAHCRHMLPEDPLKKQFMARALLAQGNTAEVIRLLEDDPTPPNPGLLYHAYARSGRREEAAKAAAETANPFEQVLIYAGLGDKDRTLEALDRMAVLGALRVGRTLHYPELSFLAGDPRVAQLRKKVGLPH